MVLLPRDEQHAVVRGLVPLVPQSEDDLASNLDRKAAEHGAGLGLSRGDYVEHELMWDRLALFDSEAGIAPRENV